MNISKTEWYFNMKIELHMQMCPISGLPVIHSKIYDEQFINIKDYVIPEKFRKWCSYKGTQFHAYILELDNEHHTSMNVKSFLDNFPEWEDIKENFGNEWTEEDHNEFKEVVEYLAERPGYVLSWSY